MPRVASACMRRGADGSLPRDYGHALLQLHDRRPFPNTPQDIADLAAQVRDKNFRIETAADGIHVPIAATATTWRRMPSRCSRSSALPEMPGMPSISAPS